MTFRIYISGLIFGVLISSSSFGMTALTQINTHGEDIELVFNGKIGKPQIITEYLGDIIQINFKDASIYPAKIVQINSENVTKVFAYQYSPKLVRCRFSMKKKAEEFKDRLKVESNGKVITIKFQGHPLPGEKAKAEEIDEKAILDRVLAAGNTKPTPGQPVEEKPVTVLKTLAEKPGPEKSAAVTDKPLATLTGGKPLPSVWSAFTKLGGVLLLLLIVVVALKKLKGTNPLKGSGLIKAISRFAPSGLGKDPKMIQVVSTHYLDPKKSIAVVRIAGRLLVLGVSNDSINLITQMSDNIDAQEFGDDFDEKAKVTSSLSSSDSNFFSDLLSSEKGKPVTPAASTQPSLTGVRSRIRSRLEGLKPL